jgi:hypothetical protein
MLIPMSGQYQWASAVFPTIVSAAVATCVDQHRFLVAELVHHFDILKIQKFKVNIYEKVPFLMGFIDYQLYQPMHQPYECFASHESTGVERQTPSKAKRSRP